MPNPVMKGGQMPKGRDKGPQHDTMKPQQTANQGMMKEMDKSGMMSMSKPIKGMPKGMSK